MVINSTNINKTNNTKYNNIRPRHSVGNPSPSLGQTQKCDKIKPVNGIPPHFYY
jgi:AAA+ ATPase superfamily predicted ATPase